MALLNPGLLGGQQPSPYPMPRVPWGQNPVVTMAGLGLVSGRNLNEGLANLAQTVPAGMAAKSGMQQFMLAQQERQAKKAEEDARRNQMNEMLKMWPNLSPEQRSLAQLYPDQFAQQAFGEMGGKGGTFQGTGIEAQDSNILLTGDPSSPEYAMAYTRQFLTPKLVSGSNEQGQMIATPVMPPVPQGIRPPTGTPSPQGGGAPSAGGTSVGAPIVTGTVKPTEQQNRQRQLYDVVRPELDTVKQTFPALKQLGNQVGGMLPGKVENFVTTPDYQRASNSLRTIIATYLYSTSGATANPGEVENQVRVLMPMPGESDASTADKLRRIETMVESIKRAAGPTPDSAAQTPGGAVPLEEWLKQNP